MQKIFTKNAILSAALIFGLGTATSVLAYRTVAHFRRPEVVVKKIRTGKVESGALLKNDQKLQACYQDYLKTDPAITDGNVQVHMTITRSGAIDQLEMVESDLKNESFTNCLVSEIKTRRLVATADRMGKIIRHTFRFHKRTPASLDYSDSR